jgi:hypothetical protein
MKAIIQTSRLKDHPEDLKLQRLILKHMHTNKTIRQ